MTFQTTIYSILYLRDNMILFSQIFTIGYLSIVTICPI